LKRILATMLMPSLLALPSSASASSRFVIDHASPMRARVQLDFTIVIPETLLIGSVLVVGNSGTLAFSPNPLTSSLQSPRQATRSDQAGNIPVNYLVAMP
jgi:hypothetical protein